MSEQKQDFLKKFMLFSALDDSRLKEIARLLKSKSYAKGASIFLEEEEGDKIYFLKKGKVKIYKTSIDGDEQILDVMKEGDVFGEVVLFGINNYPASTMAITPVKVDYLTRNKFRQYFESNPEIAWGMLKEMARKLSRAQHKIKNLGLRDTKGRVATLLLDLFNDFAESKNQLTLSFNQQELASFIGTTRETVSRTLSEFKKEGIIDLVGNKLIIKDLNSLKEWT